MGVFPPRSAVRSRGKIPASILHYPMNYTISLTLALAALVAACAPARPAPPRQVVFVDALTGCKYAIASDGRRRIDLGACVPRRRGAV
jgi:hypothetical protein